MICQQPKRIIVFGTNCVDYGQFAVIEHPQL